MSFILLGELLNISILKKEERYTFEVYRSFESSPQACLNVASPPACSALYPYLGQYFEQLTTNDLIINKLRILSA